MKQPRLYCSECRQEIKPQLDRGYLATEHDCPETEEEGWPDAGYFSAEGELLLADWVDMVVAE